MAITAAHSHLNNPSTAPITDYDDVANTLLRTNIRPVSTPPWPTPTRPRTWPAATLAAAALVLAAAALIVTLTRPAPSPSRPTTPTYSAAETADAQQRLCDAYRLAASEVEADTTGGADKAIARIATTNAAIMLDAAATTSALDPKLRGAAQALAAAYARVTATGSGAVATDQEYHEALSDSAMKAKTLGGLCNG